MQSSTRKLARLTEPKKKIKLKNRINKITFAKKKIAISQNYDLWFAWQSSTQVDQSKKHKTSCIKH